MTSWTKSTAVFAALLSTTALGWAQQRPAAGPVVLTDEPGAYTLSNGVVKARVDKSSGDLLSLEYNGTEMLATIKGPDGLPNLTIDKPGINKRGGGARFTDHQYGFWSHDTDGPNVVTKVTIDPKSNGGARGEVSVKGISEGKPLGPGPGGPFISDVEIRYTLGRGDQGVYTYSIFEHQPTYPAHSLSEARFCAKLADFFDWMMVGPKWNKPYPKLQTGEHENKYNYTANQFENPVFGWASSTKNVAVWFVNASNEYLSGGPTKVEFLGHRDTNAVQAPTVLNYWRSSHYGGAITDVAQGEHWTKVIGPFLIYANSGANPQEMYKDALAQGNKETQKWPYAWVSGVDYPLSQQRAAVSGRLLLKDPSARMSYLRVGLSHPDYTSQAPGRGGAPAQPRQVHWQTDAKHYQFWVRGDDSGRFRIPNVRPGNYTLHAIADGVLGEFAKADITVAPGKNLDLGNLEWKPVRHGKQVWEIGIPNRTGAEFLKGNDYAHDGMFLEYAKLFPNDVQYTVGKSDFAKDWYFQQVPHALNPDVKVGAYNVGAPEGRATPWSIAFNMPSTPTGNAHLRLAIASAGTREIEVQVNGKPAGKVEGLSLDPAISQTGITGIWSERDFTFDAGLLKSGANEIKLTVPAGRTTAGIIYDYLRLEIAGAQ